MAQKEFVIGKHVYALIPARGGSKSIPLKNLAPLAGEPLIAHTIRPALRCRKLAKVFVSTDSKKIRDVSLRLGALAPFLRPASISGDLATDFECFMHWLEYLQQTEGKVPKYLVHLRPTSPLRSLKTIERALSLLRSRSDIDAVRSVAKANKPPYKMWKVGSDGLLRNFMGDKEKSNLPRQLLPTAWVQTATIDVVRTEALLKHRSMIGRKVLPMETPSEETVDIDSLQDLEYAEFLMKKKKRKS